MKSECPHCGSQLEYDGELAGQSAQCPACNKELTLPPALPADKGQKIPDFHIDFHVAPDGDGASRSFMTISQFMATQKLEGGVELDKPDAGATASSVLSAEQGRKYKLGDVVATGGMGAILNAKDLNLRRSVAMKVILKPEEATRERVLRFIEEAQVTSQLEHPAIVPIHELGVDSSGNVFYTMKFVQGTTLEDILNAIADGDARTTRKYSLLHLLTIFQRVCDAVAFAHSKRVIHRDLKPENIMVGEFGEVHVMDWGLAKVLPKRTIKKFVVSKKPGSVPPGTTLRRTDDSVPSPAGIDSVRKDKGSNVLKTIDGTISGTPAFMSPEQATGRVDDLDERTDIYALGGILYNILVLRPPIEGKDMDDALEKVSSGKITHLSERGARTRTSKVEGQPVASIRLQHLPEARVPDSLAAVAMKALSFEPQRRYQTVTDLQADVEAYQNGFATSAERAGAWKQIRLFVLRNMGISIAAAIILLLMVTGYVVSTRLWFYAEIARTSAEEAKGVAVVERNKARQALDALKGTAPALAAQARVYKENRDYKKALESISYAVKFAPDKAEYRNERGNILQTMLRLEDAAEAYAKALKSDPKLELAKVNLDLCRRILDENKGEKQLKPTSMVRLYSEMRKQQRFDDALATISQLTGAGSKTMEDFWSKALADVGVRPKMMKVDNEGLLRELDISGSGISDLRILAGMPLQWLNIGATRVTDLTPLKGMPLDTLDIWGTQVSDLSPLKGMPLQALNAWGSTNITDVSALKGMPLQKWLVLAGSGVTDLTPLKGMSLPSLDISDTKITDLTPLKGMKLVGFEFTPKNITKGIDVVRNMKSITGIGLDQNNQMPAAEFWKKYDAGEFK